jgi:hypothetical protein
MIGKGLLFTILLFGSMACAVADYADAMRSYERQEYRQALQLFRDLAASGDADAQYMLGRMHEAGHGTLQDFVAAHQWYNLAAAAGHRHAATARDVVAGRMSPQQIGEAQRRAQAWRPTASAPPVTTAPPPAAAQPLSGRTLLAGIQRELSRLGYDPGPVDGLMGNRTRNAIRAYQQTAGMVEDGQPSTTLLARLREDTPVAATPTPDPSREVRVALEENFRDGDFQRNPAWTVQSGRFKVDSGGLRTVVEPPRAVERETQRSESSREEIGFAVLQLILQQTGGGYRLVYNAGAQPALSLVRLTANGGEVLATNEAPLDLENGRFHTINWTRDRSGVMQVRVDGRRVIQVRDQGLRQGFQGFVLANHLGAYNLRRIRIEG